MAGETGLIAPYLVSVLNPSVDELIFNYYPIFIANNHFQQQLYAIRLWL